MRPLTPGDRQAIEAKLYRDSFSHFARRLWGEIDPQPIQWGWHMEAIAKCLQAVTEGKLRKLIISVGPGCSKSMLVSVLWPAYQWARDPSWALMTASMEQRLVCRDSQKFSDLIKSPLYQRLYGSSFSMAPDLDNLLYRKNSRGGERIGVSVGSGTGYRATAQVIDDPLSADDARSAPAREAAAVWLNQTMSNRYRDQSKAIRIVIAQRLHTDDCTGVLLRTGEYQHLCLPTEYDPASHCTVKDLEGNVIFSDPRTTPGELLTRFGFGPQENEQAKRELGSLGYAAQQSQAPIPVTGSILKRTYFEARHTPFDCPGTVQTPTKFAKVVCVVDAAFKGGPKNDRVAMLVTGIEIKTNRLFILDMAWGNYDLVQTVAELKKLNAKWHLTECAVELKANGDGVVAQLKHDLGNTLPLIGIEANDSKDARVSISQPYLESGVCVLPAQGFQSTNLTVTDFLDEVCTYPLAKHDDATDALCHTVIRYLTVPPQTNWQQVNQNLQRQQLARQAQALGRQ